MNEVKNIDWKVMVDKISSYEGTIRDLCKENNITEKQFYYHRRKLRNIDKNIFHSISLKSESNPSVKNSNKSNIKIEIGKATIYIPADEIATLSAIIKNLSSNI